MSEPRRPTLAWGFVAFLCLLPVHALLITLLFGTAGWPAPLVRVIAAWKELLIAILFVLAVTRTLRAPRPTGAVYWLDLVVAGLGVVSFGYLIGSNAWFGTAIPLAAELYGLRDTAFVSLLYFVGRASPEVVEQPWTLKALVAVGLVTSTVAIIERIMVTPEMLVLLGLSRYVQDFLGAAAITAGNAYGLPDNYWTEMGGHLVQRAGSTYLSAQAFAISFLIIMPAATLWVLRAPERRAATRWLVYTVLWAGLLLSVTRMTIAICTLQTVVILFAQRRWRPLVGFAFTGLAGLAAAIVFVPAIADFVWRTLTWETASSVTHLSDWSLGLENFARLPLGAGLGSTDFVAMRFGLVALTVDNQYLRYAVELGALGLLLHVTTLAGAFAGGIHAWRTAPAAAARDHGLLLAMIATGVALNAITAVVFNAMVLSYIFYWLTGAVTSVARQPAAGAA